MFVRKPAGLPRRSRSMPMIPPHRTAKPPRSRKPGSTASNRSLDSIPNLGRFAQHSRAGRPFVRGGNVVGWEVERRGVGMAGPRVRPWPRGGEPDDRWAYGRSRRGHLPRGAHAEWRAGAQRPDPIAILKEANAQRIPELVSLKMFR